MDWGGYYAWGETEEKSKYGEKNYLYCIGEGTGDTGFDDYAESHYQDLGDIAGTQYDVAHVKWGGKWQMPTIVQFKELAEQCSYKRESDGAWFEGPNGGKIFMSAAGSKGSLFTPVEDAVYWSSTPDPEEPSRACSFCFHESAVYPDLSEGRWIGFPVRPVWVGR